MMRTLIALIVLGSFVSTPASAQIQFPASWAGTWEVTTTERECGSPTVIDFYTDLDTICAGEGFDPGDEAEFQCTGSISDDNLDVSCSGTVEILPGCTATFVFANTGTISGDSFTGTETFSITYEGNCPLQDICTEGVLSGVRTGPEPTVCATTVAPVTWGLTKTIYR